MKPLKRLSFLLLLVLSFYSCVDLEHINTFCGAAIKTLGSYSQIDYSFTSSFLDYNKETGKQLPLYIQTEEFKKNIFATKELTLGDSSELKLDRKADAAISYFIAELTSYFEGLSKISAKDFVDLKFDDLSKELKADDGVKKRLGGITDDQIDAGAKIAKIFADEILGKYREKKLRQIIINNDSNLSKCIDVLNTSLNALFTTIANNKLILSSTYEIILSDTSFDIHLKPDLKDQYYQTVSALNEKGEKIKLLITALSKIREGHNKIVHELSNNHLDTDEIKNLLDNYSAEVFTIYQQIKKITQ